ncbi:MAG: RNA methyltransferase [Edaphobacter sp.]|uniref:TrmH family RNA methyltransferase n=1 Tax=Edaphobacter sp. TaxID=1934404 RepID=UPI00239AAADF|nr:RNA methyltransferase [Edaphobacter sp.]MDE1175436.1 RNA methyltransferase [Edaphobacter sp.]
MAVSSEIISSRSNQRVKQLRAAFTANPRLSEGLIAIEGEHLLEEALRSGIVPQTLYLTPQRPLPAGIPSCVDIIRLSDDVFRSAVETQSPQGIAALIQPPLQSIDDLFQNNAPLLLIAAGLQDPGNLGTLVRSAEAFGASGIITTPGTVSPWNQKAIRSSVGSVFRLPVIACDEDEIAALPRRGIRLFAAVGAQDAGVLPAQDSDMRPASAIMIGNEGSGLSETWLRMATARITIPCPGPVESLNAAIAGSLLLYEASRQRSLSIHTTVKKTQRIPNPQQRRPTGATR